MRRPSRCALCVSLALGFSAPAALAQDGVAEAARRELIAEAERASDRGDHTRAVELLTRAAQVRMSPSLRQALADELLETRAWLRAYAESVLCQREANADPRLQYRADILRDCARVEARARPHLAQVVVQAPSDVSSLRVRVGGAEVPRAFWGVPYPVSPGPGEVDAQTDDGRSFHGAVTFAEGQTQTVAIALTTPVVTPVAPPVATVVPPAAPPVAPPVERTVAPPVVRTVTPPVARPEAPPANPLRIAAWSALGAGALGLGVGLVATVIARSAASDFNNNPACGELDANRGAAGCDALYGRASTMQSLAVGGWIVGGLGVAAGAVLFALPGTARRASAGGGWGLAGGPGDVGASLVGRF